MAVGKYEPSYSLASGTVKQCNNPLGKTFKILKRELPYDQATPRLGIC